MLSDSQRQAVIRFIEEKDREICYIKNWLPISLPNVDYKIMSKALTTRLKEALPDLISCQQTAYVKNRFIGEGGRLISDILEISNVFNLRGYIVTVDIEKAFHSLSHSFLLDCLKKIWIWSWFYKIGQDTTRKPRILYYQCRSYNVILQS